MTTVNPAAFYEANIREEKEYVRIYSAYEVYECEDEEVGALRITINEDGYELGHNNQALNHAEFEDETAPAEGLELPLPKMDLSEEELRSITPVRKGEYVSIGLPDAPDEVEMVAYRDGFSIKADDGRQSYMTNFQLTSQFNYAGRKYATEKEVAITLKGQAPLTGILLAEETTFAFKSGNHTAPAGYLLYRDAGSADGYGLHALSFPNAQLRISARWSAEKAAHDLAAQRQAKLNKRPAHFKPK